MLQRPHVPRASRRVPVTDIYVPKFPYCVPAAKCIQNPSPSDRRIPESLNLFHVASQLSPYCLNRHPSPTFQQSKPHMSYLKNQHLHTERWMPFPWPTCSLIHPIPRPSNHLCREHHLSCLRNYTTLFISGHVSVAIRTRSPWRRIPVTGLLPHLSHVAPQQTSPPKPLHAMSLRPRTRSLIHLMSHPGTTVFPVTGLPLASSSVPCNRWCAHSPHKWMCPSGQPTTPSVWPGTVGIPSRLPQRATN